MSKSAEQVARNFFRNYTVNCAGDKGSIAEVCPNIRNLDL